MNSRIILALVVLVTISGCSSIRSTLLDRNESNTGWCRVKHLKGVPITLKVPTHLRVYVYKKQFLEQVKVAGVSKWQPVTGMGEMYDFGSEVLYTEEIFTTDFARPAAGMSNLKVDLASDQYIQNFKQDITDNTLQQIGNLVDKIPTLFTPLGGGAVNATDVDKTGDDVSLKEIKSVVAAGVFEVNDPNFELQVQEFISRHLNNQACTTDATWVPPHLISDAKAAQPKKKQGEYLIK